jgi:hypothetical protein
MELVLARGRFSLEAVQNQSLMHQHWVHAVQSWLLHICNAVALRCALAVGRSRASSVQIPSLHAVRACMRAVE